MYNLKKALKTKNGVLELTIEETIEKFNPLLKKFARDCVMSFKYVPSAVAYAFDDYHQTGRILLVKAFEAYDIEKGVCFSTMLSTYLKHMIKEYAKYFLAEKRFMGYESDSFDIENIIDSKDFFEDLNLENKSVSEGKTLMERFNSFKKSSEGSEEEVFINEELDEFLVRHLSKEELLYYRVVLYKKKNRVDKNLKDSIDFTLEKLAFGNDELDKLSKKIDLHKTLNLSRPTLNKRMFYIEDKVKDLTEGYLIKKYGRC